MRRACPAGGKEKKIMYITCLDMEGVLVPEIWIAFAEATGIPELKKTTRDEPALRLPYMLQDCSLRIMISRSLFAMQKRRSTRSLTGICVTAYL